MPNATPLSSPSARPGEPFEDDVAGRVIALIAQSKSLTPASITTATSFDELQIDSLDKINLSFEIEEMFSIQIPDASLNSLRTIGDVVDGVHRLRAEVAA
jgi:acyl carrier protein